MVGRLEVSCNLTADDISNDAKECPEVRKVVVDAGRFIPVSTNTALAYETDSDMVECLAPIDIISPKPRPSPAEQIPCTPVSDVHRVACIPVRLTLDLGETSYVPRFAPTDSTNPPPVVEEINP
eukprot:763934-Hanusia_phi.AAC.1